MYMQSNRGQEPAVRPALLCERQHFIHPVNEFVGLRFADVQRTQKLQPQPHMRARRHVRHGAEPAEQNPALLRFGFIA